jgi:predicted NUDIX family phosphoesterase
MTESIWVFDAKYMDGFSGLPRFSTNDKDIHHMKYGCADHAYFTERAAAETNEDQKQIIPYVVIRRGNTILAYLRSKKSGEVRLHNKWSIGIGGHINPQDDDRTLGINMILSKAVTRELLEELEWGDTYNQTINNTEEFGIIYDDSDPVGRVHLGYVLIVDIPEAETEYPQPREDTIADCQWFTVQEASKLINLEGWSKIVLEAMLNEPHQDSSD